MIALKRTNAADGDFNRLIALLDEELRRRYPETQRNFDKFNLVGADTNVIVAYSDGEPVGCGCFKCWDDGRTVEIKRMFTADHARGRGVGGKVLEALEIWAVEAGRRRLVLETMIRQPEAIALYRKHGFAEIEKYGPYVNSEHSVCMGKTAAGRRVVPNEQTS